ncbi:MAG: hypothetical protein LUF85_15460 [Bacteroides sp.]|nr:hypothetical protein [Bacteroides sp.]
MLTEDLKERIGTLARTKEFQKIAASEEFYFAKAREAFDAYINYKKDDHGF